MAELESAFERLLGRQPTEQEVQGLYRVKNALDIRDNDALWLVLMALQSYDSLYRKYPNMMAEEMNKIVEAQRTLVASMVEAETKRAFRSLAEAVSTTSTTIAATVAESSRLLSWGWMLLGLLGFGGLCMFAGALLASGQPPFWARGVAGDGVLAMMLDTLGRTPAGWIAAVGGAAAGLGTIWRLRIEILSGKRIGLLVSAAGLIALSIALLVPAL
jgi:hypothetical protein